jgi:hypothetical protein
MFDGIRHSSTNIPVEVRSIALLMFMATAAVQRSNSRDCHLAGGPIAPSAKAFFLENFGHRGLP